MNSIEQLQQIRKDQANNILKGFGIDIEKAKGEGSRGGKVIGHTKSGKPVYETAGHEAHKNFTAQDHYDASNIHYKKEIQHHTNIHNKHHGDTEGQLKEKEAMNNSSEQKKKHEKEAKKKIFVKPEKESAGGEEKDVPKTKSGKEIEEGHKTGHKGWTSEDHKEAMEHYSKKRDESNAIAERKSSSDPYGAEEHETMAKLHNREVSFHKEKAEGKKSIKKSIDIFEMIKNAKSKVADNIVKSINVGSMFDYNSKVTFKKTGKELKEKFNFAKIQIQAEIDGKLAMLPALKEKCTVEFDVKNGLNWDVRNNLDAESKKCYDNLWDAICCIRRNREQIKEIDVLVNNIDDKKSFELTAQDLKRLEMVDDNTKSEDKIMEAKG